LAFATGWTEYKIPAPQKARFVGGKFAQSLIFYRDIVMKAGKKITIGQLIFTILYILFWPTLFLFLSGNWMWVEGLIFGIWFISTSAIIVIYLYFKDPSLLAERLRKPGTGNQKAWDKIFIAVATIFFLSWIIIIPLDSQRFKWTTNFPRFLQYVGCILLLLSSFFLYRSFLDNTFLSPLIRIQEERQQKLVTTGVYGFVRHPMYLGGLLMFIGAPMLMGSYYGVGISFLIVILVGLRTLGEEKMMSEEFETYKTYKLKVKYRFFPFIW
jgi:protein-S-isoprenylcysteine O-methyltransferase Ste14